MSGDRPVTEDDLQGFVDGALDRRRRAEVESYLAAHEAVAARVAMDIALRDAMRTALDPIAEEPIPANLNLNRLVERVYRPRQDWMRHYSWQAAAAVVLMLVGGTSGWTLRSVTERPVNGIASLAREATDSYAVFAPDLGRPVEIKASDEPALIKWASKRLERKVAIPNLSSSGYRFIGGRVVPTPHGPAALYMFENKAGTRLVMLSRPMKIDRDAPLVPGSSGDTASVSWAQDGLGFSLVGPLSANVLQPIADNAKAQTGPTT